MQHQAYTLHDVKALQYHTPFFAINDAIAKRMVGDIASDLNTSVGRHPSDYKLYRIGFYDDALGTFHNLQIMEHVVDVVALLPSQASPPLFEPGINQPGGKFSYNGEAA